MEAFLRVGFIALAIERVEREWDFLPGGLGGPELDGDGLLAGDVLMELALVD